MACLSVCLLVTTVTATKTDEPIEMSLGGGGVWIHGRPRNQVLDEDLDPACEGGLFRKPFMGSRLNKAGMRVTDVSSVYCPLKESFRDILVLRCPGRKKELEHMAVWRDCWIISFFLGGGIPPPKKKMPAI